MLVGVISDTHCGARNSSDLFMSYQERFYSEIFFPYMNKHNIKKIIHLGDYYEHRKFVNFKALNHNRKVFLDKLREYGIHMYIIPGNHDVYYKNTNELCSIKELQGYYTDCVTIVSKAATITLGGMDIGLVPWINADNYQESMEFLQNTPAAAIGGHFELAGFEMNKGVVQHHGMDTESLRRFESVWSGHYHTKSSQGNITYLGSQMEFNWSDCEDPKFFHILDTKSRELEPILNPITLFEKIVYDDRDGTDEYIDADLGYYTNKFVKVIVVHKKDSLEFNRFIDRLQKANPHELKIAETFIEFSGDSVEDGGVDLEDTSTLLDSYVESVDTDLDTDRLISMTRSIYVQAQNVELL
jgi:DNA repair exonuclease SbcCD nuclease subunit